MLTIVTTKRGVCHLLFGSLEKNKVQLHAWLKKHKRSSKLQHCQSTIQPIAAQIQQYFSGNRKMFDLPLDISGTVFQKKVWSALLNIQYGETRSYKEVAQAIGAPKAVRAIGRANNMNPLPIIIPCHRVIGSNGNMVGYGGGIEKKEYLLTLEGAIQSISS